jgi:hypothetical protein
MKGATSVILIVLGIAVMLLTGNAATGLHGTERTIVEVSGGVIAGGLFLILLLVSAASALNGPDRCDECGRPTDPRLAYSEEPNTKNPPCPDCKRPLPDSQWNS